MSYCPIKNLLKLLLNIQNIKQRHLFFYKNGNKFFDFNYELLKIVKNVLESKIQNCKCKSFIYLDSKLRCTQDWDS